MTGHHQNENIMASQFRFPRLYISDHTKHVLCFSVLLFLISFVKFVEGNTDGPLFGLRLKNLTVEMGKNATFTCYVKNIGGYKVGWVKADTKSILAIGEFRISHNERVTVSNERQQKHHLHITGVTLEDAGPYMCQLNTAPMKSQVGYLNVVVKPDITKVTGTEGIVEGGTARLTCEAIGYPTPEIYWVREKGQHIIIWDKSIGRRHTVDKVEGNVLELHKIKRSQMGTYFCVAKSGYPPAVNQRVEIEVHFRPVISVPNQKVYAKEGQDVALECIIESYPKGLHYWELESGETLSSNNMKYLRHEFTINEYSIRSRLTILDFTTDDQGVYKCICKNSMNHAGDRVEGVVYLHMEKEFEAKEPLENDILTNAVDYPRGYGNERSSFGGSESTTYFDIEHESNGDNPNRNYQQNYAWQEKQTTAYTNDYDSGNPYYYNSEAKERNAKPDGLNTDPGTHKRHKNKHHRSSSTQLSWHHLPFVMIFPARKTMTSSSANTSHHKTPKQLFEFRSGKRMSSHLPTLEVENPDHDTVPTADLLDWSVSGISGISTTFEKQDGVSEMSSSRASSLPPGDLEEVEKLLHAMQSLVATPNTTEQVEFQSLQPELTNNDDDEETSVLQDHLRTPTNSKKANHDLTNTTPPVKDPGLTPKNSTVVKLSNDNGGSSSKLDHMRSRLKQLELIQPNLSQPSGASKIPRRSLSFTSDSAKSQKTTSTYSKSSNPMDETVVPQTPASNDKVKKLEELLRQEAQKFKNQDSQIQSLRQVNRDLKADLERNRTAFKEKEHILSTLKNQWSQTLQRWSHEKDLNVKTLQEKDLTINKLNEDLDIVRNQVSVFEKELDRALSVADRFKTKMEEEEGLKDKLLDELMHERENGAKRTQELHQKIKQLSGEKVVLEQDLLSQMTKVDDLDVILTREKETSTKLKRDFQAEKGQFQEQIEDLESRQETLEDQLKQNKALETSLHNFYQRQMESILSEKIDMLQTHVEDLERNMIDEREDLVKQIQSEHSRQLDEIRERFSQEIQSLVGQYSEQKSSLERSLRAARQEADCLREQLRLADKTSLTFGSSFKSSNSFRSLSALKTR
eukprot:TCALIF_05174-PA protein Name:"Similar to LAC Lachesin (Schistocerca americana)" AED:0.24 eAED:0.25 QI:0/0.73/0.7/1/0.68/0.7/20/0/1081